MLPSLLVNPLARRLGTNSVGVGRIFSSVKLASVSKPQDPMIFELPQHLEIMVARLQNGENIYSVLTRQPVSSGRFAGCLKRLAIRLQLGETLEHALSDLSGEADSPLVSELVNKISTGVSRGTPLANQLLLLAVASKNQLRVAQLKEAGRNELRMLIPLVFLILPVTIAFAIFPSLQILQLGV